jgi:hypothetical protein
MVFQILKTKQEIKTPLFNAISSGLSFDDMQRAISAQIFNQIKMTPELVGMLDTVVTDHFMGDVDYFDKDGKALGSTNLKRAKEFWVKNKINNTFYGQGMDYFIDGSCFGWYDSAEFNMSAKQKEQILSYDQNYGGYLNNQVTSKIIEEIEKPRSIGYIAASTTEIVHDDTGILAYKQEASGKVKVWSTEQIVHIKLMEFNGEVRGFSGLKALVRDIALMYMIKENMIAKLGNGGSADNIIFLKNATNLSKAKFERLKTALESFSHLRKSHGNMPIDAEVGAIPLGEKLKDMEYRELAMFAISEFCLSLGLPTSRVPFMMVGSGGTSNKGELSGNSEDAYQKKINNRRLMWENSWNPVMSKANFTFKFRRDNLQDDIRETQAAAQRVTYVQGVMTNLKALNKQLSLQATLELLSGTKRNIDIDDVEEYIIPQYVEDEMNMQTESDNSKMEMQNDMKMRNTQLKSKVSGDRMASKMRTASNNGVSA